MATPDIETIIVGGGVIGLAAATSLSTRGMEVMVLERHPRVGAETSSRNSEVIHAGLYYPQGSLRAKLCVEGKKKLYTFAAENGVDVKRCGKLLVATSNADLPALEKIATRARINGVDDTTILDADAARDYEPEVSCIAALLSPSTGVIDTHGLLTALEGHITTNQGSIVLSTQVTAINRMPNGLFEVTTSTWDEASGNSQHANQEAITARHLVLAAGLEATTVGNMLNHQWRNDYTCPQTSPAKGHYYTLTGRAPFERLIYPIPSGAWLGVHLTLDIAGQAKFGPDLTWIETVDYSFDDADGERHKRFEKEVRRYWPGLPDGALQPGYTGIRPKIYAEGEPPADFAIHGTEVHGLENVVALYGIESPGLTSSLAIGDMVADMLLSLGDISE